jgi:hypothetical protein
VRTRRYGGGINAITPLCGTLQLIPIEDNGAQEVRGEPWAKGIFKKPIINRHSKVFVVVYYAFSTGRN